MSTAPPAAKRPRVTRRRLALAAVLVVLVDGYRHASWLPARPPFGRNHPAIWVDYGALEIYVGGADVNGWWFQVTYLRGYPWAWAPAGHPKVYYYPSPIGGRPIRSAAR